MNTGLNVGLGLFRSCWPVLGGSLTWLMLSGLPCYATAEGSLSIWMRSDKAFQGMTQLGQQFELDTGIPVTVEIPEGAIDKFIQAAQAGRGPDLLGWAHDRTGDLAAAGLVQPVDMSPLTQTQFLPQALQAFTVKDELFGYPIGLEAIALIYNRQLVSDPPESIEDILTIHTELATQAPFTLQYDYTNFYFSIPFLTAQGGYIFGDLGPADVGLNHPGSIAGLELLKSLVKQGVIQEDVSYSIMVANMVQQNLGMMITGPWEWSNLEQNQVDFGVVPLPRINGYPARPFIGVQGFMINRSSPNADLIQEFMEQYVLTPAGLEILNQDVPIGIPSLAQLAQEWSENPRLEATLQSIEDGILIPNNPAMNAVWTHMSGVVADVIKGRVSVTTALEQATQQIQNAIHAAED